MKISEANKIINSLFTEPKKRTSNKTGFMVSFEKREGRILASGYFPDKHLGEKLIPTVDEAWTYAKKFAAAAPDEFENIYVIDHEFSPQGKDGYYSKKLRYDVRR